MSIRHRIKAHSSMALAIACCLASSLSGCDSNSSGPRAPVSLQIRFTPGGAASAAKDASPRSFAALAAPSTSDEVTRILVDISHADSGLPITTRFELTEHAPGAWSGQIPLLPRHRPLRFTAQALDAMEAVLFSGETLATLAMNGEEVEVALAPAQDGQTLPMPRLTRLLFPAQITSGQEEQFTFTVQANAGETLGLQIHAADGATPAAEFSPARGTITLTGPVVQFMTVYTAPEVSADTSYAYRVTLTVASTHGAVSVTTNFQTLVKARPASGPIVGDTRPVARFNPVILALTANGSDPPGTIQLAAEVNDDSAPDRLTYQWSYAPEAGTPAAMFADGGGGNPGLLQGYTVAHQGVISLAVTDEHGGTTTLRYPLVRDQFADAIRAPSGIKGLAAGWRHTCVHTGDDRVRCWGLASLGQLGYGNKINLGDTWTRQPYVAGDVPLPAFDGAWQLVAGLHHTCVLTRSGLVLCWGDNRRGQLGYGRTDRLGDDEPVTSFGFVQLPAPAIKLAAGANHTCAVLQGGALMCWGANDQGQLGRGTTSDLGDDEPVAGAGAIDFGGGLRAKDVAAGSDHTCALFNTGEMRCWGGNQHGQLGYGHAQRIIDAHLAPGIANAGAVRRIVAGNSHTCAVSTGGGLRCWGRGELGQLGLRYPGYPGNTNWGDAPNELPRDLPRDVSVGGVILDVAAGGLHTCAITSEGKLKCWGIGSSGQLGNGSFETVAEPQANGVDLDDDVTSRPSRLTAGNSHTCALRRDGAVRCWGAGGDGRLGRGSTADFTRATGDVNVRIYPPAPDELPPPASFESTGTVQTLVIPPGVHGVEIKAWGAGGGGADFTAGGAGSFAKSGPIAVSAGETLTIVVGRGGRYASNFAAFGGGGTRAPISSTPCTNATVFDPPINGGGGGYSGVFRGATVAQASALVVAGGGGGAGAGSSSGTVGNGGAGGGAVGGVSNYENGRGGGGTQTAGGAGGVGAESGSAGGPLQGGFSDCAGQGGGGGGGYFGGGGSAAVNGNDAGGGGGSSYAPGGLTLPGTGAAPPAITDSDYASDTALGATPRASGRDGRVVIRFL